MTASTKYFVVRELKKKIIFDVLKHLPLTHDVIQIIIDNTMENESDILRIVNKNSNLYYHYNPKSIEYQELDLY